MGSIRLCCMILLSFSLSALIVSALERTGTPSICSYILYTTINESCTAITHYPNALPIPKLDDADIAPINTVSMADQYHACTVTQLFPTPNTTKNPNVITIVEIVMDVWRGRSFAFATKNGMRGMSPNKAKLKNVTTALVKGFSSSGINCNYSIIITAKKPSLFLASIFTISSDTSGFKPIYTYISFISCFSASQSVSIYPFSLISSAFMNSASLLVAKQSAIAIDRPSVMRELNPSAIMVLGEMLEPMPDRAMIKVVMMPSSPPYTADFMYYPPFMCFSLDSLEGIA